MNKEQLIFIRDSVIANELMLALLTDALLKLHPETTAALLNSLEHALTHSKIPTEGARKNLEKFHDQVRSHQPNTSPAH